MRCFAGTILTPDGWLEGHVVVEGGRIVDVARGEPPVAPIARGTIVPSFVNAHTHVGDAVARSDKLPAKLADAVKPPDSYKHRVLASTPAAQIVEGIRGALREVEGSGAAGLVDFREGGLAGLQQLRAAAVPAVRARVYARPSTMAFDEAEARALLQEADGLSVSSLPDDARAPALAALARAAGKGFALHASEPAREPIAPVLDLRPELLVHLTFATRADLEAVRDARVPVAVCPRSNARWVKRIPDVRAMLDLGMAVALGTDNAMLHACDVLAEARALRDLAPDVAPEEVLRMLAAGWRILDPRAPPPLTVGAPAELLVFHRRASQPAADVLGADAARLHRERAGV